MSPSVPSRSDLVRFGESAEKLERELRSEYPEAEMIRSDDKLAGPVKGLRAMLEGESGAAQ